MRAVCEQCEQVQPIDWRAGDLCGHCGQAVRREVRCYWCVKWTPFAKFCRGCGASVVEERLYGAARMLKDAGTDRFTIPKQLVEFDPEQIENFTRIYQRHAVAVARHVEELRFLERFLVQKHWSTALDEQLVAQLPWPEATLAAFAGRAQPAGDDLTTAGMIRRSSPLHETQQLAAIVGLRLGDREVLREVWSLLTVGSESVQAEAALLLSSWRVRALLGQGHDVRLLLDVLRRSPWPGPASVRMAALGAKVEMAVAPGGDAEEAFELALVRGDVEALVAALSGDPERRLVAGLGLARLGEVAPLAAVLRDDVDEVRWPILQQLAHQKGAAPQLRQVLLAWVEQSDDAAVRERASRILSRALLPGDALRIACAGRGDRSILQSLLRAALTAADLLEVLDHMLATGAFVMSQYGLSDVAKSDRVPDDFVIRRLPMAAEPARPELLRFAELQLEARGDEALHRCLLGAVFGPGSLAIREAAWNSLRRWYRSLGDHRGEGPLRLEREPLALVEPLPEFLHNLVTMLDADEVVQEIGLAELLAHLFATAQPSGLLAMLEHAEPTHRLVQALLRRLPREPRSLLFDGALQLLGQLGTHPGWCEEVLVTLRAVGRVGNYYFDRTLRNVELARHGIPPESDWRALPSDFAAMQWAGASLEKQQELVLLVDHQIVHAGGPQAVPILLATLLRAALLPGFRAVQERASERYADRARGAWASAQFAGAMAEALFGSLAACVQGLAGFLADASTRTDRHGLQLLQDLLREPGAQLVAALAAEASAGEATVMALVQLAKSPSANDGAERLRARALRCLAQLARQPGLQVVVAREMEGGFAAASPALLPEWRAVAECLPQPAPDADATADSAPVRLDAEHVDERATELASYAEKQVEVERLSHQLQTAVMEIMMGPGSAPEKSAAAMRLSEAFQVRVRAIYGA